MKLSIITVNLNNAMGLQKTMESVFSQTSRDFEYIIIDGGSTDGSKEVIQSFTEIPQGIYKEIKVEIETCTLCSSPPFQTLHHFEPQTLSEDPMTHAPCSLPITYWVSEPDRGIFHAMNKGILIANGEYCQFLNSGDWLVADNVIEKMLKALPDCSIPYGNMLKQMPNGKIYRDTGVKERISMFTFYKGTLNHSSALIKRNLFQKYGLYDESLKIVSDWKWYLISIGLNNEPIKYIDIDVTCFEMNGISNRDHDLEKKERRKILEELLPVNILSDYDAHWRNIDQISRVNRYKLTKCIFFLIERTLFKWEKLKQNHTHKM